MVIVNTSNMQFADGLTTLGFGSGDVSVRHIWVLSPTEAIANVTVSPFALQRGTVASVMSGFQVYEQSVGFQVLPANPNQPVIGLPVPNAYYPLQDSLYPGAIASIYGLNLAAASGTPSLSVAGQSALILYASANQINFVIPSGAPVGVQPVVVTVGSVVSPAASITVTSQ